MAAATVSATPAGARASTGIEGLDAVLGGGFTPDRLYLIEGSPGSGKTTLALQFLLEGLRQGEAGLLVTLSESAEEPHAAASHGWSLDGVTIRELIPSQTSLREDEQYTMFHPSEVELSETTRTILADIERVRRARVVFDSLSEFRLLSGTSLRYRRQILAMKQFFRCEVRQAISVVKKRNGQHEGTIRAFGLDDGGITVGEPLREFVGVLTGMPVYEGEDGKVMRDGIRP